MFVRALGERWDVAINWLEYRFDPDAKPKHHHVVVDFNTASRNGEPFDQLILGAAILPNPVMRKCTAELKVRTTERWARRDLGLKKQSVRNVIGFRYDEQRRWKKLMREGCDSYFPMVLAKVTKADVNAFWSRQNFDLGIDSALGNCNYCYLKGKQNIIQQMRYDAVRGGVDGWWDTKEQQVEKSQDHRLKYMDKPEMGHFLKHVSYAQMEMIATSNEQFDFGNGDDEVMDCFCSD